MSEKMRKVFIMTATALIIIIFGLVAWAAKKTPDRHIDLMVMLEDRHNARIEEDNL